MRNPHGVVTALPVVDLKVEATILAYHVGRESGADVESIQSPRVGAREVQAELESDLWAALQEGVI